ncbi:MAG: hypothetical protein NTX71_12470 [Candidatus Aureabacteria bacterium]|nr:hypothetical protein [Candidatus Auribacterota bacterium]
MGRITTGLEESRLVPLTRVTDRLKADEIIGMLRDEGIEAVWRVPHSPPLDGLEEAWMGKHYGEILVLDVDLERSKEIVREILD